MVEVRPVGVDGRERRTPPRAVVSDRMDGGFVDDGFLDDTFGDGTVGLTACRGLLLWSKPMC